MWDNQGKYGVIQGNMGITWGNMRNMGNYGEIWKRGNMEM